jgi:hypothetical protein
MFAAPGACMKGCAAKHPGPGRGGRWRATLPAGVPLYRWDIPLPPAALGFQQSSAHPCARGWNCAPCGCVAIGLMHLLQCLPASALQHPWLTWRNILKCQCILVEPCKCASTFSTPVVMRVSCGSWGHMRQRAWRCAMQHKCRSGGCCCGGAQHGQQRATPEAAGCVGRLRSRQGEEAAHAAPTWMGTSHRTSGNSPSDQEIICAIHAAG